MKPGSRGVLGPDRAALPALVAYAVCLVGIAYACATPERGASIPWSIFFAPLSVVSRLVGWDRSAPVVIAMFFGVAILWPGLWYGLRVSPAASRRGVGVGFLIVHYLSAIGLAATAPAYERGLISRPPLVYWACLGAVVYVAGQLVLWNRILHPVTANMDTGQAQEGSSP